MHIFLLVNMTFTSFLKLSDWLWMSGYYVDVTKCNIGALATEISNKQIMENVESPKYFLYPLMKDCLACHGVGFVEMKDHYRYLHEKIPCRFVLQDQLGMKKAMICCPDCICWKCGKQNAFCGGCVDTTKENNLVATIMHNIPSNMLEFEEWLETQIEMGMAFRTQQIKAIANAICKEKNKHDYIKNKLYPLLNECTMCEGYGFIKQVYQDDDDDDNMKEENIFFHNAHMESNLALCSHCICYECGGQLAYCNNCNE